MSTENKFAQALVSYRSRTRWAFTVHAPGVASTTQSGPVASLATT